MPAERPKAGKSRDEEAGTLGELLDGDSSPAREPEHEWVALVHAVAAGDKIALHGLFQRAHRLAFTLIMRIVEDRRTAEELTLDVFHDVWRRASSYDATDGSVVGWIMNQARSRAIDRRRFDNRKKRVDPQGPLESIAADAWSAAIDERDQAARLHAALAHLSHEERVAIETAFFSELTYAEAAERLGLPLGTVKTRIRTGLEKLRARFADEAGEP